MTASKGQFGGRRILQGTVVSDKTEKTVVVAVKSSVRHPLYKKIVRRVRKFMAHDDEFGAHMGDVVRIVESRPLSKRKRWRVVEVLYRADLPEVAAESIDLDLIGEVKSEEEETPEEEAATPAAPEAPAEVAALEEAPSDVEPVEALEEPPDVETVTEEAVAEETETDVAGSGGDEEAKTEEPVAEAVVEEPVAEAGTAEAESAEESDVAEEESDATEEETGKE